MSPDTPLREKVRKEAARYAGLYTEPVIEQAADLLAELLDAGTRHGIQPDEWEVSLAAAALDAVTHSLRRGRPAEVEAAVPLLAALAERLTELGQPTELYPNRIEVTLPYLPSTPVRFPLVASLAYHSGWDVYPRTGGTSPVVGVRAPFTVEGARAVADTLAALNRGELGNPFIRG